MNVDSKFTQPTCGTNTRYENNRKTVFKPVKLVRSWQRQTWNHSEGMPSQPLAPRTPTKNNPCCG